MAHLQKLTAGNMRSIGSPFEDKDRQRGSLEYPLLQELGSNSMLAETSSE